MMLTIPDTDHGKIRVFSITTPVPGLKEKKLEALVATFGNAPLDPDFVDVIELNDLGEMTFLDYLSDGYDVQPDQVDIAALTQLEGTVVLLMSRAHEGRHMELALAEDVRHVTTLGTGARMTIAEPIANEGAGGHIAAGKPPKLPKSDARIGGMVATVALLVMFALVAVMVWVGG